MIVYRLSKKKYSGDLSGRGSEKFGGRWNNPGVRMVYTSGSIALCALEVAVHTPFGIIPKNYFLVAIEIPNSIKITLLDEVDLPRNWSTTVPTQITQKIGDKFINENKNLALRVPSATAQGDYNYLINPNHKDFGKLKIKKMELFSFDERLFVRE
jgi:RES domain-containing protein